MRQADIVIIGGSAAGATAAITARRHYPDKSVWVVRQDRQVPIPCGIPYIYGTLGSASKNLMPDAMLEKENVKILVEKVTAIEPEKNLIQTTEGAIGYDRLVLAAGSLPGRLPVPGFDLEDAYPILKDVEHLDRLHDRLKTASHVVVIGCGFIGIEFADEIRKMDGGKHVTVLEIAPYCLSLAYDEEFCHEMEAFVRSRGVDIRTHAKVAEIEGREGHVSGVRLTDGTVIPADVVIFGVGAAPNVELAKAAGLKLGVTGAVAVDRTMKTSHDRIFACGDCVEKTSFFGGRPSVLRLASIATLEARIAGANLYGLRREHDGTVGVWSTAVDGLAMATAGLTESVAQDCGYDCVAVVVEGPNRHPGAMPGGAPMKLKLVFERNTRVLLGGQVRGNESAGEVINIVAACVQKRMVAEDLALFQMGTHPALTASPVAYPLVNAAEIALSRMREVQ